MPQNDTDSTMTSVPARQTTLDLNDASFFANALIDAGVNPSDVKVAPVTEYITVELDALCSQASQRKGCVGESPLMVVTDFSLFPEADDFTGYIGYFRCEAITEDGEHVAFTHYMFNKETGERSPLFEWCEKQSPPFALKIAHMSTRRGFSVFRPIPAVMRVQTT